MSEMPLEVFVCALTVLVVGGSLSGLLFAVNYPNKAEVVRAYTANEEPKRDATDKMIALFDDYSEFFGLTNNDFPDMNPEDRQCEFETEFRKLICEHKGHDIGPDQCGKPEHDLCYRCQQLRTDIETA